MASRASRYLSPEPARLEQREAPRVAVAIDGATVRRHADRAVPATLRDLSAYGCRVASADGHAAGDRVWIRLAGGLPIAATVVWSADGLTGCRFDAALARATLRALTLGIG